MPRQQSSDNNEKEKQLFSDVANKMQLEWFTSSYITAKHDFIGLGS